MIALVRTGEVPTKLSDDGPSETALLIEAFEAGRDPDPKNSVYGHDSVKDRLFEIQNGKCAFCETRLVGQFGNVEHFRPKKRWQAARGGPQTKPGYFWLGYDWGNFLLSCEVCNIRYKRDLFPLRDESARADPQSRDISGEEPLFIDPYVDDPAEYLSFLDWNIFAPDDNARGVASIGGYGLFDVELDESRRDRFEEIRMILEAVDALDVDAAPRQPATVYLLNALSSEGPYSAMVEANFGQRIRALAESS